MISQINTYDAAPRRIRYQVAASLDGFIASPDGGADWIVPEPTFDFEAHFAQFDTFLMGRRTYEVMQAMEGPRLHGTVLVVSRTLRPQDHPGVEIVADGLEARLQRLREEPGKDIWLFGGGELFRSLLAMGQVDTVEVAVIPILLGEGIPLIGPGPAGRTLVLDHHTVYPSGMVYLGYSVPRP